MTPTTSYGNFAQQCRDMGGENTLHAYVAASLGDFSGDTDYDVDGLAEEFRAAVNEALAGTDISLAGDEFYGPYPAREGSGEIIGDAIESVDFWALAANHERTARP